MTKLELIIDNFAGGGGIKGGTVPTRDRLGVVTVHGELYELADIGMRMFTPRELFNAQGFPATYRLDIWCSERRNSRGELMKPGYLPKDSLVRMCGNSVCPDMAAALVPANCGDMRPRLAELLKGRRVFHLGLTKGGSPRHPLYLPGDAKPGVWMEGDR